MYNYFIWIDSKFQGRMRGAESMAQRARSMARGAKSKERWRIARGAKSKAYDATDSRDGIPLSADVDEESSRPPIMFRFAIFPTWPNLLKTVTSVSLMNRCNI